ncbi:hypothetical protein G6F56_010100 [Rhizopus delemar]|nr:hypothetical protein G6F56_010100 [Rhizopus delemar]
MRRRNLDYLNTHTPQFYASPLPPPPPPNSNEKPSHTNTFVHKLYNMVIDTHYQHLISWSYPGSSFIVCNLLEFSKDVLPKHFKHNNFSSFVRQLNIPDLLDDIKRKTLEPERKETDGMMLMQASQAELVQQMQTLYANFSQALKDMQTMRQVQQEQQHMLKTMANYISQQNGGHLPQDLFKTNTPSIFLTPAQQNTLGPPSPSPSMLIPDDEFDTLYSNKLYAYQ